MRTWILSMRNALSSVSWDPIYELENLIARTCDAQIIAPAGRASFERVGRLPWPARKGTLQSLVRHTVGRFERVSLPPKKGPELLLCIGISSFDLEVITAIPDHRTRFDLKAAYVFDAWGVSPDYSPRFDHVFVALPEVMPEWRVALGRSITKLVPFGVDALSEGSCAEDRPIDLLSYGRVPPHYRRVFSERFNRRASQRLFLRTEARSSVTCPPSPYDLRSDRADASLLYQLLRRSKASLCFDTLYPGMRYFPHSFVTLRWYDAFAAGCAAVGRRPVTPEADRLMPWPDAAIELPDDPEQAADLLEDLFEDKSRLTRVRLRNHYEALARHDWRLRVGDMLRHLNVPLPAQLKQELELLERRTAEAERQAQEAGALPNQPQLDRVSTI